MMVHYFAPPADKYGGYQPSLAIATGVSGTARFGTTSLGADKPRKADGNAQMLECENQLNNYSTWNDAFLQRKYQCPASGLENVCLKE